MKLVFELTDKITDDVLRSIVSQYYHEFNRADSLIEIIYPKGQLHINDPFDYIPGSKLSICLRQLESEGKLVCKLFSRDPIGMRNTLLGLLSQGKEYGFPYWRSADTFFQYSEPPEPSKDELALAWWKRAFKDRRIFYFNNSSNFTIIVDISNGMASDDIYDSLWKWLRANYVIKIRGHMARVLVWGKWPESISQYYGSAIKVVEYENILFTEESFMCKLLDGDLAKMGGREIAVYKRYDRTEERERDSTF